MDYNESVDSGVEVKIKGECSNPECHCDPCECEDCQCCDEPALRKFIRSNDGWKEDAAGGYVFDQLAPGDYVNWGIVKEVRENPRVVVLDYFGAEQEIKNRYDVVTSIPVETINFWRSEINNKMVKYPNYPEEGVVFEDINPVLMDRNIMFFVLQLMSMNVDNMRSDYIICPESRGFVLGSMVATLLNKGIILARKPGKLPGEVKSVKYKTEYSEDELQIESVDLTGKNVWFIDDVFATGGTYRACKELVEKCGGTLAGGTVLKNVLAELPDEVRSVL